MQDLISHPAVQAVVAPLVSSLFVALAMYRTGIFWQGMAVVAGFLTAILLITGLGFDPLTSTRKIILCSLIIPFLAIPLYWRNCQFYSRAFLLSLVLVCSVLWVIWPVLSRQEGLEFLSLGLRVTLFVVAIGVGINWIEHFNASRQGGVLLALGLGVGGCSLIVASALYAQLAFSVSAAVGGLLLVLLLAPFLRIFGSDTMRPNLGTLSLFVAATPLALIGAAATVYAKLPWAALISLILVPLAAVIPLSRHFNPWVVATLTTITGLILAIPAFWLAMIASGDI